MKNQYFGDVNDYVKYGLLRALHGLGDRKIHVAWMLTPDDGGPDGRKRDYLTNPELWRQHDPELFDAMAAFHRASSRPHVGQIEATDLLFGAAYHSSEVPDDKRDRQAWRRGLLESIAQSRADAVFFDPDNGIEVGSKAIGRKGSSKYVAWDEIEMVWSAGCSVVLYQHFPREQRESFTHRVVSEIQKKTTSPFVVPLRTAHVLFLLVAQRGHEQGYRESIDLHLPAWAGKINI